MPFSRALWRSALKNMQHFLSDSETEGGLTDFTLADAD